MQLLKKKEKTLVSHTPSLLKYIGIKMPSLSKPQTVPSQSHNPLCLNGVLNLHTNYPACHSTYMKYPENYNIYCMNLYDMLQDIHHNRIIICCVSTVGTYLIHMIMLLAALKMCFSINQQSSQTIKFRGENDKNKILFICTV